MTYLPAFSQHFQLAACISAMAALLAVAPLSTAQAASPNPPVVLVQSGDASYRVNELEQEVRRLNGKVEELTFQLLQMQEQMRKMQEDNELRFQELEDRRSQAPQSKPSQTAQTEENRLGKPEPSGPQKPDVNSNQSSSDADTQPERPVRKPAPVPRMLGTLTFDKDGNVVDANRNENIDNASKPLPGVFSDGVDGSTEAAEFGPTPNAVFSAGKTALERRRYRRAERAFRAYLRAWPSDPREAQARYYLANALFWRKDYYKAANIYLDTHNAHPNAPTAADNLLGLGLALAGLNQREVACATYSEVLKQYPQASDRLGAQVAAEQASAKCSN